MLKIFYLIYKFTCIYSRNVCVYTYSRLKWNKIKLNIDINIEDEEGLKVSVLRCNFNHCVWSLGLGKWLVISWRLKENGLTVALSNKENSGKQQICKNEAALNLFNVIV